MKTQRTSRSQIRQLYKISRCQRRRKTAPQKCSVVTSALLEPSATLHCSTQRRGMLPTHFLQHRKPATMQRWRQRPAAPPLLLVRRRISGRAHVPAHCLPTMLPQAYTWHKTVACRNASLECLLNPTVRQAVRPPLALPAAAAAGSPGGTPPAGPARSPAACRRRRWPSHLPRLPPPAA